MKMLKMLECSKI